MKLVDLLKEIEIEELSSEDWMSLLYYCPYDLQANVKFREEMELYTLTEHKVIQLLNQKKK
jgi:hypothetical protein